MQNRINAFYREEKSLKIVNLKNTIFEVKKLAGSKLVECKNADELIEIEVDGFSGKDQQIFSN